jgi:hypothetical protein
VANADTTQPAVEENLFDFGEPEVRSPESFFQKGDRSMGQLLQVFGILLGFGGLVLFALIALRVLVGGYIWPGVASALGWSVFIFGVRIAAPPARRLMKKDTRRPILLLRAFREDATEDHHYGKGGFLWMFGAGRKETFEQTIQNMFLRFGPLIAIGRPGEAVPPLGASRLWLSHVAWQQKVDQLLQDCLFVVMIMGRTNGQDGLTWEVRRVFQLRKPKKLILLMPPVTEAEAKLRWEQYRDISAARLPPFKGGELLAKFSKGWKCHVTRIRGRRTQRAYWANVAVWARV